MPFTKAVKFRTVSWVEHSETQLLIAINWIKTDSIEAGMGPVNSNCGNAGNGSGDFPDDPV